MTQTQTRPRLDVAPGYLLILLAPVAVYLLLEYLLKTMGDASLTIPTAGFAEPARMIELTGRYKFMAAFAFFGSVSIAVLLIFGLDLAVNFTRRALAWALLAIVASASVGIVLSVLEPEALGGFETYYLLGREFFEASLSMGKSGLCAAGSEPCIDRGALGVFRTMVAPINALTSLALAAAMTGLILSLAQPATPAADLSARATELVAAQATAQRYLYCAGLLLTAGITFLLAWMYWPGALIADAVTRAAYLDLVGAVSLYVGVGYSVLILSCYLPVMLFHSLRLEGLRADLSDGATVSAVDAPPPPALPDLSYLKSLKAVAAILSPIMASAIGTFGQGVLFQ